MNTFSYPAYVTDVGKIPEYLTFFNYHEKAREFSEDYIEKLPIDALQEALEVVFMMYGYDLSCADDMSEYVGRVEAIANELVA